MNTPAISIIVPVYGVEKYLDRCVKSIIVQDFTDFELILVDDGSPDRCPIMCDAYMKKDCRIRVVHKSNGGLTSARIAGYNICRGKYVLFLDSDDFISPKMVSSLYKAIIKSNADLALCGWYTERDGRSHPNKLPFEGEIAGHNDILQYYVLPLIGRKPNSHSNLPGFMCLRLFSRRHINKEMFVSERKYITEDILFNLMYGLSIKKIIFVNRPLYYYCYNEASLTNRYRKNVFPKMMARYDFCVNICQERKIMEHAKERLMYNLFSAVCFSILNACKLDNYGEALHEIKMIFANDKVAEMFKLMPQKDLSLQQKVIFFANRRKWYQPMYYYLRWRMKV